MQRVDVVSVEDDGTYIQDGFSGSTVRVVLRRGNEYAEGKGIVIWQDEFVDNDLFDEWKRWALNKDHGYRYWQE